MHARRFGGSLAIASLAMLARGFGASLAVASLAMRARGSGGSLAIASLAMMSAFHMAEAHDKTAADEPLAAFSAHYLADWKSINVGTSDLVLKPDTPPGHYLYTWTITARGFFRLVYSNDVTQKSWFSVTAGHVRPERYRADDGSASVDLNFDWDSGRARGVSEKKTVDLPLKDGIQDVMSIQVEVMLDLKNGTMPGVFRIVDKDEVKEFTYAQEPPARIRTALGELDTVVVSSRRTGGNRILRMWFAPSLGFVPVQAERTRDGKLEFAMRIKTLKR